MTSSYSTSKDLSKDLKENNQENLWKIEKLKSVSGNSFHYSSNA